MCGLYGTPSCKLTFCNAVAYHSANHEVSPRPDCLALVIYSNSTNCRHARKGLFYGREKHEIPSLLMPTLNQDGASKLALLGACHEGDLALC
jgi:hypothetical protein